MLFSGYSSKLALSWSITKELHDNSWSRFYVEALKTEEGFNIMLESDFPIQKCPQVNMVYVNGKKKDLFTYFFFIFTHLTAVFV